MIMLKCWPQLEISCNFFFHMEIFVVPTDKYMNGNSMLGYRPRSCMSDMLTQMSSKYIWINTIMIWLTKLCSKYICINRIMIFEKWSQRCGTALASKNYDARNNVNHLQFPKLLYAWQSLQFDWRDLFFSKIISLIALLVNVSNFAMR